MQKKVFDVAKAVSFKFPTYTKTYTHRDMMLYALTLGFSKDPLNRDHFKFTYEADPKFTSFYTMPCIAAHEYFSQLDLLPGLPDWNP